MLFVFFFSLFSCLSPQPRSLCNNSNNNNYYYYYYYHFFLSEISLRVNLYNYIFYHLIFFSQSNKRIFYLSTFSFSIKHYEGKLKYFLSFYFSIYSDFLSSHFSTPNQSYSKRFYRSN